MKRNWLLLGLKFAAFAAIFVTVFSFVIMQLWNWLMPALFGLRTIGFWQAMGLLALCKILFGGFHRHHRGGRRWRGRMMERWAHMTPEEREKMRQSWRGGRCGPFEDPTPEAKA